MFLIALLMMTLGALDLSAIFTTASAAPSVNANYVNYNYIDVQHGYTGNGLEAEQGKFLLSGIPNKELKILHYTLDGHSVDPGSDTDCTPYVEVDVLDDQGIPADSTSTYLFLKKHGSHGSTACVKTGAISININNFTAGSHTLLNWVNSSKLSPVGLLPYRVNVGIFRDHPALRQFSDFDLQSDGTYSNASEKPKCASYIDNISSDHKTAEVYIWTQGGTGTCTDDYNHYKINLGNSDNFKLAPADTPPTTGDTTSGATGSNPTPTLECKAGYNPLNWLLCGAVKGMVNIVGTLDKLINSELSVGSTGGSDDPSQIFGSIDTATGQYSSTSASGAPTKSTQNSFYRAWSSVRNLALGLMVVAGLIVIIAQALGTELVDAYTFRKILPRLLIAAFAITLSWQLLQFFVKLTNDLGYGVRFLIYQPFTGLSNTVTGGSGGNIATDLLGFGALAALGIFGLLSFAATAALAVFVAFILLILRQIVVIVLIIAAPIAIVAYILPNTQNIYKLWWESLSKALLVFPIIAAFIAAGRVFSLVAIQPVVGPSGIQSPPSALNQFIGFAAYFAPYFLLPAAFKLAGGTLARLSGAVNDRSRGGFDRLKNFRGNQSKKNMAKMGNYQRLSDRNAVTRGLNTVMGGVTNPRDVMGGRRGIQQGRRDGRAAQGAAALKDDKTWSANQGDDNFYLALANRELAEQKRDAAKAKHNTAVASGGADSAGAISAKAGLDARQNGLDAASTVTSRRSSSTQLAALNELAKSGYQFDYGDVGYGQLQDSVSKIVGSDQGAQTAAMSTAQFHLKNAGRGDLAGINNGGSNDIKGGVRKMNSYARGQTKTGTYHGAAQAWLGAGTVDSSTGETYNDDIDPTTGLAVKGSGVTKISNGIQAALLDSKSGVNLDSVAEWNAMLAGDYSGATDANKLEIQKQLDSIDIIATSLPVPTNSADNDAHIRFLKQIEQSKMTKDRGMGIDPSQRTP